MRCPLCGRDPRDPWHMHPPPRTVKELIEQEMKILRDGLPEALKGVRR